MWKLLEIHPERRLHRSPFSRDGKTAGRNDFPARPLPEIAKNILENPPREPYPWSFHVFYAIHPAFAL
ncbi:hypothetical protein OVY01_16100 [Robbsia sp. Bb-Pol-6]|uniref:Uncharacterized protein n=1 Tax=Robbsia betulipollinis TaxID=2981849 RepID=A0ABT3ZQ78_9BURK|nr:hypothetical protein [Robbsia betulipollinis]